MALSAATRGAITRAARAIRSKQTELNHVLELYEKGDQSDDVIDTLKKAERTLSPMIEGYRERVNTYTETVGKLDGERYEDELKRYTEYFETLEPDGSLSYELGTVVADAKALLTAIHLALNENDRARKEQQQQREVPERGETGTQVTALAEAVAGLQREVRQTRESSATVENRLPSRAECAKLEPLEIPLFSGTPGEWLPFFELFTELVHNENNLSEIEKFAHMKKHLRGEAAEVIAAIPVRAANYEQAFERLREVFGDEEANRRTLTRKLEAARANPDWSSQLRLVREVQSLITSLITFNEHVDSTFVVRLIASKFRQEVKEWIAEKRERERDEMSTRDLLAYVERRIQNKLNVMDFADELPLGSAHPRDRHRQRDPSPARMNPQRSRQAGGEQRPFPPRPHRPGVGGPPHVNDGTCAFCGLHRGSGSCTMRLDERRRAVREKQLCMLCLRSGHRMFQCSARGCSCGGRHHEALCHRVRVTPQMTVRQANNPPVTARDPRMRANVSCASETATGVQIWCGQARLRNPQNGKEITVGVLLDTGAAVSIVEEQIAKELELAVEDKREISLAGLGARSVGKRTYEVSNAELVTENGYRPLSLLRNRGMIVAPMTVERMSNEDKKFIEREGLNVICESKERYTARPRLLLGADVVIELIRDAAAKSNRVVVTLPSGMMLMSTSIGYIPSGRSREMRKREQNTVMVVTSTSRAFFDKIERFFAVDQPALDEQKTEREARLEEDKKVDEHFERTIRHNGERYEVQFCRREDRELADDNYRVALSRLNATFKSLQKNEKLLVAHNEIFQEQLRERQIEIVPHESERCDNGERWYLPHQFVLRPEKETTPLRIVFDASSHTKGANSLNDILLPGRNLTESVHTLLVRARCKRVIMVADVQKAFLQIAIAPEQRDLLRFLWLKDPKRPPSRENTVVMRFCTVPFGVIQSPYLLNQTVRHHVKLHLKDEDRYEDAMRQIIDSTYVDNTIFVTDEPDARYYETAKRTFAEMGMNLRDFVSNSKEMMEKIAIEDRGAVREQSLLGMKWSPETDEMKLKIELSENCETKREMFSALASVYDPLGLLVPMLLPAKLQIQNLWKSKLKWDEKLNEKMLAEWRETARAIDGFEMAVERNVLGEKGEKTRLVLFTDASSKAMAACVYAQSEKGARLVFAKSKLAHLHGRQTIPKLELEALSLGIGCLATVVASMREIVREEIEIFVFCDSITVLHWIRNEGEYRLGPYVGNRCRKIREGIEELRKTARVHEARYVPSAENPADFGTRGLAREQIDENHDWWRGPAWLQREPTNWPAGILPQATEEIEEERESVVQVTVREAERDPLVDLTRFSQYGRAINTVAYALRFVKKLMRKRKMESELLQVQEGEERVTARERSQALTMLIRDAQRGITRETQVVRNGQIEICEDGIYRSTSKAVRKAGIDESVKRPIFLPAKESKELIRLLAIRQHAASLHAGAETVLGILKQRFWIPRGRAPAKRAVRECVACRKLHGRPFKYPDPPELPEERVVRSRPFENIGMDYLGPLKENERGKRYVLLITCLCTRLVHLEVVDTLDTVAFFLAFRRFTARRGVPKSIVSDSAHTFGFAARALRECENERNEWLDTIYADTPIEWKLNAPHSPWKGGIFERMVGCVKGAFTKAIGRRDVSDDELRTLVAEIESVINCRPLTYAAAENETELGCKVVRPVDFILPDVRMNVPELVRPKREDTDYIPAAERNLTRDKALRMLAKNREISDRFWEKWSREYLLLLRDRSAKTPLQGGASAAAKPTVGEVVLVIDDNKALPRSSWKVGRIIELRERSAMLRMTTGRNSEQPLNRLIPLELRCEPRESEEREDGGAHPMITRQKAQRN